MINLDYIFLNFIFFILFIINTCKYPAHFIKTVEASVSSKIALLIIKIQALCCTVLNISATRHFCNFLIKITSTE